VAPIHLDTTLLPRRSATGNWAQMRQLCASWRLRRSSTELTSDRHDTTRTPIEVGPHWMIMWPFDPKNTGLPTTHKATGADIMWAGSPYAHLHVMGRP
jgi:hypothetical protein